MVPQASIMSYSISGVRRTSLLALACSSSGIMQPQYLVSALLLLATSTNQLQEENMDDFLIYPVETSENIRIRRDVASKSSRADHDAFVEEKLIQHSQALEHLLRMVTTNSLISKRLMQHLSRTVEKPSMPEALKSTRRSNGKPGAVRNTELEPKSPWCNAYLLCERTLVPVCAFDDNFGYGKFVDKCHMFQVNCYLKYNFSVVKDCNPTFTAK